MCPDFLTRDTTTVASASPTTTAAPTTDLPAFCLQARALVKALDRAAVSLTDPATLKASLQDASAAALQSTSSAPAEVKADLGSLSTSISDFRVTLQAAGYTLSSLTPDKAMTLQSLPVMTALAGLERSVTAACGPPA
jgi:hypothetical protein